MRFFLKINQIENYSEKNDYAKIQKMIKSLMNDTLKYNKDDIYALLSTSMNRNYFVNCLKMANQSEVSGNALKILEEIFNFIFDEVLF